jgi:hypothetical protein
VSRHLESRVTPNDLVLVFQDINLAALAFNSTLPPTQMQHVRVWSEVCGPVLDAHAQERDIWFIVWLWSDPANMEACFTSNHLSFTTRDFPGWPNLRVYHLSGARRS